MLMYYSMPEALPKEFCNGIYNVAKELDAVEAEVHKKGDSVRMDKIRNSRIAWLSDPELMAMLQMFIEKANIEAEWNFDVSQMEIPQVSFYTKGQKYDWHVDAGVENSSEDLHRKLSLSLTLKDNFKGGNFQVQKWVHPQSGDRFSTLKEMRKAGSIVVFPSFVFHRVTKVLEGERASLVMWCRGCPFS